MNNKLMFSSEKQDWETPQSLFDELNKKYNFETDAAATRENAKCKMFFSEKDNALEKNWGATGIYFVIRPMKANFKMILSKKLMKSH